MWTDPLSGNTHFVPLISPERSDRVIAGAKYLLRTLGSCDVTYSSILDHIKGKHFPGDQPLRESLKLLPSGRSLAEPLAMDISHAEKKGKMRAVGLQSITFCIAAQVNGMQSRFDRLSTKLEELTPILQSTPEGTDALATAQAGLKELQEHLNTTAGYFFTPGNTVTKVQPARTPAGKLTDAYIHFYESIAEPLANLKRTALALNLPLDSIPAFQELFKACETLERPAINAKAMLQDLYAAEKNWNHHHNNQASIMITNAQINASRTHALFLKAASYLREHELPDINPQARMDFINTGNDAVAAIMDAILPLQKAQRENPQFFGNSVGNNR